MNLKPAFVMAALAFAGCAGESTGPERESIAGYFVAAERSDVQLTLYDDVDGTQPEQFVVSQSVTTFGTPAIIYWWGTYVEGANGSLAFTLTQENAAGAPRVSAAAWTARPDALGATVAGFGQLRFQRAGDPR